MKTGQPEAPKAARFFVGTSGFSYDDWTGPYYPGGLPSTKRFDYYASEFPCVEINSTYYGWLSEKTARSLVSRAPRGFRFTLKLHRSLTHESGGQLQDGLARTREQAGVFDSASALGCYLAQFPNSFRPGAEAFGKIEELANGLTPLVVETRNSEWQKAENASRVGAMGAAICCVDAPPVRGLPRWEPTRFGPVGYYRFHGRNAAKWYGHEEAWERYDYSYSREELAERAADILAAEPDRDCYVFFNNHYGAQAVTNARQMADLLGVPVSRPQPGLF
ncbi:MAG: DUF72 domain-containing protein [Armatimonadetes bacterium]|nr:DUF72 domain-containing protein [Armatimonadota bacterium]NOG92625.1 DUF72 domain-containing protein [Armatimonadota bacterium]